MLQALLAISLSLLSNSIRHMFEAQEARVSCRGCGGQSLKAGRICCLLEKKHLDY